MTDFTLRECPFCGHQPDEGNLIDSIHPLNRERTLWTAGCVDNEGGCNASVLGSTREHAILLWNTRPGDDRTRINEIEAEEFAKRMAALEAKRAKRLPIPAPETQLERLRSGMSPNPWDD